VRHLQNARLGFDLSYIAASDATVIAAALDGARIADGSPILDRLRMVKAPGEIARLICGAELGEAGIAALAAGARAGHGVADLRDMFRAGVAAEAARRGVAPPDATYEYIAVGQRPFEPRTVAPGAIIKVDMVCSVDGYTSDTSRNFVFGRATDQQRSLHRAIEDAFAAGVALIRSGTLLRDVHAAATASMHAAGFTGYSRGHFGHGLGHSLFSEQWPFISADSIIAFEPDMMMAFEVPFYVDGFGAFNLEDQMLLTADGHIAINHLPRTLVEIG
jgi:Xaa-Pro aminopeptidase